MKRRSARGILLFILSFSALLWSCKREDLEEGNRHLESTVILISFDGFRWDYLERADTPNLDYLVQNGVQAQALIPVFPSKTFPNHMSIITGQYPENHGIVSNRMYDPLFDAFFWIGAESEPARDGRWYEGEPLWITAEKQGQIAATMFWPGSDAEIRGIRPTHWSYYDGTISREERINRVLSWLDLPRDRRPTFITTYFEETDNWGHEYGPDDPQVDSVVQALDGTVGALLDSLRIREYLDRINLILTSDHGMTGLSRQRVVFLDDYIDLETVTVVDWSPVTAILPAEGLEDTVYHALDGAHPNLSVYRKEELPERFHYRNHRRITPIICVADEGWSVTSHEYFDTHVDVYSGGTHGYDNRLPSMHGIFIAYGPAFKDDLMVRPFMNIHIYELICHILKLNPAQNDGSLDSVMVVLEE
ncbi:MAG: ectonucleotide pyrophosphatase/phosphodiesterase [Candidatus Neomarinimicrobiota bacterium]